MDLVKLREELERDEGVKYEIYLDHLGYPTFGIGHLVKPDDPENGREVASPVSKDRVIDSVNADVETVIFDCQRLYTLFQFLPEEAQRIIANMMFNLGYPRLSKFKGMKAGIDSEDWNRAADEMVDSRWYKQVTNRAQRLVDRMRKIS